MDVESAGVAIRPRNPWQAIDLGFEMARHWFLPLWAIWILGALPVCLIASALLYRHWFILMIVIWWFKPLYELPMVHFLSRAAFTDPPTIRSIFRNWFQIVRGLALSMLTFRRFSLTRSFDYPVLMLEGLYRQARRDRLQVLKEEVVDKCQWLTFVCYHFEVLFYLSILLAGSYLVPSEQFSSGAIFKLNSPLMICATILSYTFAMSVIAPFYTAAGFGIYLARRTLLECWDIELSFKRLTSRLAALRTTPLILAVAFSLVIASSPGSARADTPPDIRSAIDSVAADKTFGAPETHYVWRNKNKPDKSTHDWPFVKEFFEFLGKIFSWIGHRIGDLAPLLEAIIWFLLIVAILLLVRKFEPWRRWQEFRGRRTDPIHRPSTIFGLDLSDNSLSENIIEEVARLLRKGEARSALSLLYRGALWRLVNRHNLPIEESFTEGECMRLVRHARPGGEASYFEQLTQCWCRLAYAHEEPTTPQLEALSQQWSQHYEYSNE